MAKQGPLIQMALKARARNQPGAGGTQVSVQGIENILVLKTGLLRQKKPRALYSTYKRTKEKLR